MFLLTAVAAVILMASLFSRGLGSQWRTAIVPHLFQYVSYIRSDLGAPPSESRAKALANRLNIQIQAHDSNTGTLIFSTLQRPIPIERLHFSPLPRSRSFTDRKSTNSGSAAIADISISNDRRHPILRLNQGDFQVYVEFSRPRQRHSGVDELFLALGGLALLLALCYLAIRHLLKPIGKLQSTVHRISNGELTARANATGSDDLAVLAHSVDQMSERIQQMLDAKRELLLAISHELRSPLTRARVATELLEPSRHQQKLIADIEEMDTLIARLVESERLQSHVVLDLQEVDVASVITQTIDTFQTKDALNKNIDWVASPMPASILADETRLQVLFRNIIGNALQHGIKTHDDEPSVSVQLHQSSEEIHVVVIDRGPGVGNEQLASITEPFYRTDASRTRKTGGIGLGLYLSNHIAQAHGGTLEIESPQTENIGLKVTIRLPILSVEGQF